MEYIRGDHCTDLNDLVWRRFCKQADYLGYHGHKLLAVDGTYLNLPNHESIQEEFGRRGMGRGKKKDLPKSMCLPSALYDPVNYMTLDVQTGPMDGNEQELLLKQHTSIFGVTSKRLVQSALSAFD